MLDEVRERIEREIRGADWGQAALSAQELRRQATHLEQSNTDRLTFKLAPDASKSYLLTGAAGFIGSHVARRLLALGHRVTAIDEFNDYYDPVLKWENVADLLPSEAFELHQADVRDRARLRDLLGSGRFDAIIHLAARAGVRPSLSDPELYVTSNVVGTQNMLDLAREWRVTNFVYASSSSVYGGNTEFPFSETQLIDRPVSPYAVTKKTNELQAACYSRLYGMAVSGLRFFTVYGPSGRPDMAVRLFIEKLARGEPLPLYGAGDFERDYTYIDDIVDGIVGVLVAAEGRENWSEVFNLGESDTTSVLQLILMIAKELGRLNVPGDVKELSVGEQRSMIDDLANRGLVTRLPEQLGDVPKTHADISKARRMLGYQPRVGVDEGVRRTVRWHLEEQRKAFEPKRKIIQQVLRVMCGMQSRSALDSSGKRMQAGYGPRDAEALLLALAELSSCIYEAGDVALALRAQRELASVLCSVTAELAKVSPGGQT